MIDPLIGMVLAAGFAILLLGAAWHKLSARATFAAALEDYRLLPASLVPAAATALPVGEAALAAAWLSGAAGVAVAASTALLMALYALAIAINLLRGRAHIGCGCGFGGRSDDGQSLSWSLVGRNTVLAVLALVAGAPHTTRSLGAIDWMTLGAAVPAVALLWFGTSQLLANDAAIRARKRSHG